MVNPVRNQEAWVLRKSKLQGSNLTNRRGPERRPRLEGGGGRGGGAGWRTAGRARDHSGAWKGLKSVLCLETRGVDGMDAIKDKLLLKISLSQTFCS